MNNEYVIEVAPVDERRRPLGCYFFRKEGENFVVDILAEIMDGTWPYRWYAGAIYVRDKTLNQRHRLPVSAGQQIELEFYGISQDRTIESFCFFGETREMIGRFIELMQEWSSA